MNRRSMATGWCRARIFRHSSSISTSRWSMSSSRFSTLSASFTSRSNRARTADCTWSSTIAHRARMLFLTCSISRCKCTDMFGSSGRRNSRLQQGLYGNGFPGRWQGRKRRRAASRLCFSMTPIAGRRLVMLKHNLRLGGLKSIYESIFIKPSGARNVGQRSATFPSPSASVDLVTFVRVLACGSCGCCHTFPEPEAEEELAPSCCFRVLSRRERVRSTIYSGSSAGPNVAMKKVFKGRHHSPYRRSVAEAAAVQDLCRGRPQVVTSTGFGLILYAAISPGLC